MKTTLQHPTETKFAPRSLTINFESQDELDAFGTIFNHGSILTAAWIVFNDAPISRLASDAVNLGASTNGPFERFSRKLYEDLHAYYKREGTQLK